MVLTEQEFLKFLVQSSRIRAGLPNTVLGFSSSGKPQSVLKSSLGGSGLAETILNTSVVTPASFHSFNFNRSVAMNGTDVHELIAIISNLKLADTDIVDCQFNNESFTGSNSTGVSVLQGGSVLAVNSSGNGISDDLSFTQTQSKTIKIELPSFLSQEGGDTGIFAKFSSDDSYANVACDLQTEDFDPLISIQIRTRGGEDINSAKVNVYVINQ